jgi:hypothetical protein
VEKEPLPITAFGSKWLMFMRLCLALLYAFSSAKREQGDFVLYETSK